MRKTVVVSLLIIFAAVVFAAPVEQVVAFQGKIVEGGMPVDGTRDIHFYLYNVASGGTSLWNENHIGVPVSAGLFNVELGAATTFSSAGVDFTEQYWIGIRVEGGAEITPRYKLTADPYAFGSTTADNDWAYTSGSDLTGAIYHTGNVSIGISTAGRPLKVSGNVNAFPWSDSGAVGVFRNTSTNLGAAVLGQCQNCQYGGYFEGYYYGVYGRAISSSSSNNFGLGGNATGSSGDNVGVQGWAISGPGDGSAIGIDAHASTSGGRHGVMYGVKSYASLGDTNYGVYSEVSSGLVDWAGYFTGGDMYLSDKMTINNASPGSHYLYVNSNLAGTAGSTIYSKNSSSTGIGLFVETTSASNTDCTIIAAQHGTSASADIMRLDAYPGGSWNRRFRFTAGGEGRCDASWVGGGADYAEFFPVEGNAADFDKGDVILMSSRGKTVEKGGEAYSKRVLGVVSTNPAFIGGASAEENPPNSALVGLLGVIPTKVNSSNGTIEVGDYITVSGISGEGMKATEAGWIIGRAMEPLNAASGKIDVFVNPGWVGR